MLWVLGLAVVGRLYWRSGTGTVERLLGEWADLVTPYTLVPVLIVVMIATVLVVMELVSLD